MVLRGKSKEDVQCLELQNPTLAEILRAVHKCTASVNTLQERLGGLKEEVSLIRKDLQKIRERTTATESRISDIEDKLPPLIRDSQYNTRIVAAVEQHADDLENQMRSNNVRIVGFPEKMEGRDPTDFMERWLLEVFWKETFTSLYAVEKAHRVP